MASLVTLLVVGPFAARQAPKFAAFAPADSAWTILCALITTLLLLGEVGVARSRAVLAIAVGYMLVALSAILQFLIAAANNSPLQLDGSGTGAAALANLIRDAVLPISIIIYARVQSASAETEGERPQPHSGSHVRRSVILAVAAVIVLGWGALPLIAMGWGSIWTLVAGAARQGWVWKAFHQLSAILVVVAMGAVMERRFQTRFDLWLIVTLLAQVCQVILSGLLSGAAYDLAWYGGLAFGAVASGSLMVALLHESANHFEQLADMHAALLASNRSLEHLSLHDALTGLANRRHFDTYLAQQVTLMRRHRRPLALVLCDLDNFKAFNDLYGHQAGDDCLARIAVALQACCRRPADMAARYGGEEFALVLPETDLAGAVRIAEAAREAVSRLQIAHARDRQARGNIGSVMTLSGGVAVLDGHGNGSLDSLVGAADAALFEAKRQGRDRIVSSKREFAGL
jgi:diguanylate cyclase (GGDEF)-like protein